jgi:hypothetical protein
MDAFQVTSGDVNRLVKNAMSFSPPMTTLIPVSFASKWFNTLQKGKVTLNKIVTEEYTKQDLCKDFQMPFGDIYLLVKATEIMKVTHTVNNMAVTTIEDLATALEGNHLKHPAEESVSSSGPPLIKETKNGWSQFSRLSKDWQREYKSTKWYIFNSNQQSQSFFCGQ